MIQTQTEIRISTRGQSLVEITDLVTAWVKEQGISNGLVTLFVCHTSASLVIQENADPSVLADLQTFFRKVVREDPTLYRHIDEGPDDMPAHIRSALTQTHLSIPIMRGRLSLGTWQGIFLFEHRSCAHKRTIALHLLGTPS